MNDDNDVTALDYLRKIIYKYVEVDDNTAILVLNYKEETSPLQSRYRNYTSGLLKTLLSNTRSGSAQRQFGITFSSFISGVLVSLVFCIIQVILFSILRNRLAHIYQPNTSLYPNKKNDTVASGNTEQNKRSLAKPLGNKPWSWIKPTWTTSIEECRESGLDAYFFLRLLKTLSMFFLILSIVIIPILIPIHYISGYKTADIQSYISQMELNDKLTNDEMLNHLPYGLTGLDKISMSNISPAHSNRLVFHLILAVLLVCFFHHVLLRELKYYVSERNKVLTGSIEASSYHQNVLYIGNISKDFNKNKIEYFCESLIPGCVEKIVQLPDNWEVTKALGQQLDRLTNQIENRQLDIMLTKTFLPASKAASYDLPIDYEKRNSLARFPLYQFPYMYHKRVHCKIKYHRLVYNWKRTLFLLKELINGNMLLGFRFQRDKEAKWFEPGHLEWSAQQIIEKKQIKLDQYMKKYEQSLMQQEMECDVNRKSSRQAFIVFRKVSFAHIFDQMLLSNKDSEMSDDKALGINPTDIIWCNIQTINRPWALLRVAISNFLNVAIIIGWVVPVAIVGFVSQIPIITKIVPILTNFQDLPEFMSKPIASIVPAVTLIFLTEGVPLFFRWFSVVKCLKTGAQIEMDVQKWFFAFLFVHIFLVVTISSGISVVVETVVNNPINIPHLLGTNLPKCSNFFCSFVLIRGIAYFGGNLLQSKNLFFYLFYYRWSNRTPREKLKYKLNVPCYQWGSLYPIFSVLASITIIYSVIAPFVLPLASFSFIFVMFSFKYSLKYQFDHKNKSETLGKFYPQALMQLYSGIYFLEACLIGLFALANCFKLSLFMFIFMIFTISAHFQVSNLSKSTIKYLPASLASDEVQHQQEDFKLRDLEPKTHKMWIPLDDNGFAISDANSWQLRYNIEFTHQNAFVDKIGKVIVVGNPYD